jgi:hypothetical protein
VPTEKDKYAHRKGMTFRQAEGIDPLPSMLAYGDLSADLRNHIWEVIHNYFYSEIHYSVHLNGLKENGRRIAIRYLRDIGKFPIDEAMEIAKDYSKVVNHIKQMLLPTAYYDALEVVQFFLRSDAWPRGYKSELVEILGHPTSPYMVVSFPPLTVIPRGDESEQEAFETNWAIIKASPLDNAKTHLRASSEALNAGDARGAVREAISAVEGAAKVLSGDPKATLGAALKVLERDKALNPILSTAFTKLYGYTSDEKGIRHALMEGDNANVGQDEALFMFSACTAFVAYLSRKYPEKV